MRKLIIAAAIVITAIGSVPLTAGNQDQSVQDHPRPMSATTAPTDL